MEECRADIRAEDNKWRGSRSQCQNRYHSLQLWRVRGDQSIKGIDWNGFQRLDCGCQEVVNLRKEDPIFIESRIHRHVLAAHRNSVQLEPNSIFRTRRIYTPKTTVKTKPDFVPTNNMDVALEPLVGILVFLYKY